MKVSYCFFLVFFFGASPVLLPAQNWIQKYDSLLSTGEQLVENYQYDEATFPFSDARDLALQQEDSSKALKALIELAKIDYENDEIDKAQSLFLQLERDYLEVADPGTLGLIKNWVGLTYRSKGERRTAIRYYHEGIEVMAAEDDSAQYAQLYRNLGYVNQYFNDYGQAVSYADSAIKYTPRADLVSLSRAYRSKYVSYLWLGKTDEAEPFLLESWRIAEQAQDRASLKELYLYLGDYYERQNDVNKALIFYQKGLRLAEESRDNSEVAKYQFLLGEIYLNMRNPDRALTYFNSAHEYYESVGNELLDAEALMKVGVCFLTKKDYDEAEQLLLQSLSDMQRLNNKGFEGSNLLFLVDLYLAKDDQEQALHYLKEIERVNSEINDFWLTKDAQSRAFRLDDKYISQTEKLDLSRSYYQTALTLFPDEELDALVRLARTYHTAGLDSAYYFADDAFTLIEDRRISFTDGTLKAGLFAQYASFYNVVGSWYAGEKKDYSKAFELFESSKARSLMDELVQAEQENLIISQEEQMKLLQIQKSIDQLYRRKEITDDQFQSIDLDEQISRLELEYDALLEEIRQNNPAWSRVAYPEVLSLKEIQDLCDKETAVIEYAFTFTGLSVMVITKEDVFYAESNKVDNFHESIAKDIETFRNSLTNVVSEPVIQSHSSPLYQQLIAPISEQIEGFEKLIIVPDRSLALLPFDALSDDSGTYLVEKFAIKMMPSVSVFDLLPNPYRTNSKKMLALAGSGFEPGDGLFGAETQAAFAALPYTLIEVDSIATHFNEPTILRNEEVTEALLKDLELQDYQYIHFATHGAINEVAPSQSGLILSKKIQMENLFGEDGFLNAKEISQLDLNADIVVLSACNTATGKVMTGEGLLGLQRAFLTAGASSVVASLWSIYDRSTPVFMSHFYRHLMAYEDKEMGLINRMKVWADRYEPELVDYKTLALRQAKLDMLDHPYYSHPVHWASFVITGK